MLRCVCMSEFQKNDSNATERLGHSVVSELREYREKPFIPTADIDIVWILSEPGTVKEISNDGVYAGASSDLANISHGVDLIRQITAKRIGKEVKDITKSDIDNYGPTLYYNGEDSMTQGQNYEQNKHLAELIKNPEFPIPESKIIIDHIDIANTPAQIKGIARYLEENNLSGKIATVSIGAHFARLGRYIEHYKNLLPEGTEFINAATTQTYHPVGTTLREIRKIEKYSKQGDLSENSFFSSR